MSEYRAQIEWQRNGAAYTYETYPRDHAWTLGGETVRASSGAEFRGDAARVNPEEALVVALSSCHMLTFLALAAKKRLSLDLYRDAAVGVLAKNAEGRLAITEVTLRPKVTWSDGVSVSEAELRQMHHLAHEGCFIAQSVRTMVTVEPEI